MCERGVTNVQRLWGVEEVLHKLIRCIIGKVVYNVGVNEYNSYKAFSFASSPIKGNGLEL